jgi:hypothetical protein
MCEFELWSLRLELTFFDLNYIKQVFIPNEKSTEEFEEKTGQIDRLKTGSILIHLV